MHLGTAEPKKVMAVLMGLNNNGQAITLSKALADKGAVDGPGLAKVIAKEKREYTSRRRPDAALSFSAPTEGRSASPSIDSP